METTIISIAVGALVFCIEKYFALKKDKLDKRESKLSVRESIVEYQEKYLQKNFSKELQAIKDKE